MGEGDYKIGHFSRLFTTVEKIYLTFPSPFLVNAMSIHQCKMLSKRLLKTYVPSCCSISQKRIFLLLLPKKSPEKNRKNSNKEIVFIFTLTSSKLFNASIVLGLKCKMVIPLHRILKVK